MAPIDGWWPVTRDLPPSNGHTAMQRHALQAGNPDTVVITPVLGRSAEKIKAEGFLLQLDPHLVSLAFVAIPSGTLLKYLMPKLLPRWLLESLQHWQSRFYVGVAQLFDFLMCAPPGPPVVALKYVINVFKGSTAPYVLALMYKYSNFTTVPYVYLACHGTYGMLWLLKHLISPDAQWESQVTATGALSVAITLACYWIAPYMLITRNVVLSGPAIAAAISAHTVGCVIMMASDCQKHFQLQTRNQLFPGARPKMLITNGWFSRTRNPNYLGEMMIYG
eukprot:gene10407-1886_t